MIDKYLENFLFILIKWDITVENKVVNLIFY